MHPNTYGKFLRQKKLRDQVFVIMSFEKRFDARWEEVIRPAIVEDLRFEAVRVDSTRRLGETVMHDILDGICHARLVLADVTSKPMLDEDGNVSQGGKPWPQRNANVMYEVGIAHALREPDETIMVRSDDEDIIFDLTQMLPVSYDPRNVSEAREIVSKTLHDRLGAISRLWSSLVESCVAALDPFTMATFLKHGARENAFKINSHPIAVPFWMRMFELGLLETTGVVATRHADKPLEIEQPVRVTEFGWQVFNAVRSEKVSVVTSPDTQAESPSDDQPPSQNA